MFSLNNLPVINTASILDYYDAFELDGEQLRKCNRMEFKFIDGYGYGYMLVANWQYPGHCGVTLRLLNDESGAVISTVPVIVDEVLTISHVSETGDKIYLFKIREEKSVLYEKMFSKNYNVIEKKSVLETDCRIVGDDPLKSLKEILELETEMTVNFATDIKPFNVMLEGLNVGVAIDKLCSSYGLLWTVYNNQVYIYEGANNGYDPNSVSEVVGATPIQGLKDFSMVVDKLDCCLIEPTKYATFNENFAGSSSVEECFGKELIVYMPYYIAVPDEANEGEYLNIAGLQMLNEYIYYNFLDLAKTESVVTIHPLTLPISLVTRPQSFSVLYIDNGKQAQTIFKSCKYPAMPIPRQPVLDRIATDLVGSLTATYVGPVEGFLVDPIFGFDGSVPDDPIFVYNLLDWDYGLIGAYVFAKWDCINDRWVAYQQKYICPPDSAEATAPVFPPPEERPINLNEPLVL